MPGLNKIIVVVSMSEVLEFHIGIFVGCSVGVCALWRYKPAGLELFNFADGFVQTIQELIKILLVQEDLVFLIVELAVLAKPFFAFGQGNVKIIAPG